jgi:hypothetical protein
MDYWESNPNLVGSVLAATQVSRPRMAELLISLLIPEGIERRKVSDVQSLSWATKDGLLCVLSSGTGHASVYQCWALHADHDGWFVDALALESLGRE